VRDNVGDEAEIRAFRSLTLKQRHCQFCEILEAEVIDGSVTDELNRGI
jgi:hypothetical protein